MEIVFMVLSGLVVGALLPRWAQGRSLVQPIPAPVEAEADVLAAVLADPSQYFKLCLLDAEHFSWTPHRALWTALDGLATGTVDEDRLAEARAAGVSGPRELDMDADELADALDTLADGEVAVALAELSGRVAPVGGEVLDAGCAVLDAGDERVTLRGAVAFEQDPDGGRERPLRRVALAPGRTRVVASALTCAAGAAGAWWLGGTDLGRAALWALVVGSVVLSLVDIDTMFIDTRWLAMTGVASWLFAVPAAVRAGGWFQVGWAALATVVVVGGVELLARVYARLRGKVGLGGGDTMLLVVTLSVPLMVSGDPGVGPAGILAASVLAVVSRLALVVARRGSLTDPFPFGPFLAAGWMVGWAVLEVV